MQRALEIPKANAILDNYAEYFGSSLKRVLKGLLGWQREVEFAGNEVGDIEEVMGGSIALGLGGVDQAVDAFHEAIV